MLVVILALFVLVSARPNLDETNAEKLSTREEGSIWKAIKSGIAQAKNDSKKYHGYYYIKPQPVHTVYAVKVIGKMKREISQALQDKDEEWFTDALHAVAHGATSALLNHFGKQKREAPEALSAKEEEWLSGLIHAAAHGATSALIDHFGEQKRDASEALSAKEKEFLIAAIQKVVNKAN